MKKRIVPDWMKDFKVEINANKDESTLKNAQQPDLLNTQLRNTDNNMPQTRSQRSKNFPLNIENEIQHTRVLRSNSVKLTTNSKPPSAPSFPYIEYKGKIIYLTDSIDIACACDEIINWVEKQESQVVPIAFDMEWPFSFQTGPGKTALIQICYDLDVCYLFHLPQIKKIPAALYALLAHRKVRLHGVNIKNDFRKLHRDFPEVNEAPLIEQCIDLGPWCNDVCNTGGRWSMERLVLYICKLQINKDKKVRMSKWHVMPLDDNQKMYAAIDVYISQVIYKELERREKLKAAREAEVLELHGEQSLKALKTLDVNFSLENV